MSSRIPGVTSLPAPPRLKTTIIQLNKDIDPEDNNYEVLSNDYNQCTSKYGVVEQPKKKRRRSSFADKAEMARRKAETKQLHSKIEKRRRIKINREFEALQYLIPACRALDKKSKPDRKPEKVDTSKLDKYEGKTEGRNEVKSEKSEGMYKLTILKTSVEYILYLHHIIQKQHEMLRSKCQDYSFDISFSEVPLDVNQYRNIDQEYVFGYDSDKEEKEEKFGCHEVIPEDLNEFSEKSESFETKSESLEAKSDLGDMEMSGCIRTESVRSDSVKSGVDSGICGASGRGGESGRFDLGGSSLEAEDQWTPVITPVMACMQDKRIPSKGGVKEEFFRNEKLFRNDSGFCPQFRFQSSQRQGSHSLETSPFTIPIKSQVKNTFLLPDPALTYASDSRDAYTREQGSIGSRDVFLRDQTLSVGSRDMYLQDQASIGSRGSLSEDVSYVHSLPRKKFFKSKVPASNSVINILSDEKAQAETEEMNNVAKASEALLTFRKPSIERLLN